MELLAFLMLVTGGVFAGGAATFAWSRVPIWRRMPATEFLRDFAATLHWTDKVQPALLAAAIAATIGFAVAADGRATVLASAGAGAFALTLIGTVVFLVPLQRRIVASNPGDGDRVDEMRARWFRGNAGRSALAVAAFALVAGAAALG